MCSGLVSSADIEHQRAKQLLTAVLGNDRFSVYGLAGDDLLGDWGEDNERAHDCTSGGDERGLSSVLGLGLYPRESKPLFQVESSTSKSKTQKTTSTVLLCVQVPLETQSQSPS